MAGNAPVDSPTSIMSSARLGNMPLTRKDPERDWPSRTRLAALAISCFSTSVPSESDDVSSAGINGMPPISKVLRMRENCATWYFNHTWPNTGIFSNARSTACRPGGVRDQERNATPAAINNANAIST